MAILKKGSKGKPVEEIQTLLNKNGAKPKLKVDGIWGPLTDNAFKAFQKKMKLKADGKANELSLATLKYGKPLPEFNANVASRFAATLQIQMQNTSLVGEYTGLLVSVAAFSKTYKRSLNNAWKKVSGNTDLWNGVREYYMSIQKMEADFYKNRFKDPKRAEGIAVAAEAALGVADTMATATASTGYASFKLEMLQAKDDMNKMIKDMQAKIEKIDTSITFVEKELKKFK